MWLALIEKKSFLTYIKPREKREGVFFFMKNSWVYIVLESQDEGLTFQCGIQDKTFMTVIIS